MRPMGEEIALRPYTAERCHAFWRDYIADPAMLSQPYIYDPREIERYYQVKVGDPARRFFAICHGEEVIGEIQLKRLDFEQRCGTMSVHLANDSFKGHGWGTRAEGLLLRYAFEELNLATVYADTIHRNARSQHVLEKLGFRHTGDDELLRYYQLTREDWLAQGGAAE